MKLAELEADNPNIQQQYEVWKQQREQNGEDAADYEAFRAHLVAIGAPDPGEEAPEDFASVAE